VARRPLQGEAGAGEGVTGVTCKDGGPAVATEVRGVRRPGRQAKAETSGGGEVRVGLGEGEGGGHGGHGEEGGCGALQRLGAQVRQAEWRDEQRS
jgi:hypothetical protein